MRLRLTLLAVALTLLVVGCNAKPPMTEFTSTEYKFKVKFPGKPKEQDQVAMDIKFKMFVTDSRNGANAVGVADLPIPANEPTDVIQQRLDGSRDGAIRNCGGTLKSSSAITWAGKYPGREFTASITQPSNGTLRGRIYLVGTRLYQAQVMGTNTYANSSEATQFLDSFQYLEK